MAKQKDPPQPASGPFHYLLRPGAAEWEHLSEPELVEGIRAGGIPEESWVASGAPLRAADFAGRFHEPDEAPAKRLAKLVKLVRPVVFFDLETTGTRVNEDRIVEFAAFRIEPDGSTREERLLIHPGMAIPPESSAIHGISDDAVRDQPGFAQVAASIGALLEGADLAGYNIAAFDLPLLVAEFERSERQADWDWFEKWRERSVLDVCLLYKELRPRTLSAAHADLCGAPLVDAHSAFADVIGTLRVLVRLIETGEVAAASAADIERRSERRPSARRNQLDMNGNFFLTDDDDIFARPGKIRGRSFRNEMASGDPQGVRRFLQWMLTKEFDSSTKRAARLLAESMPVLQAQEAPESFAARWQSFVTRLRQ